MQKFFLTNKIKHIDYKDTELLKSCLKNHGRINQRINTGVSATNQRKLAVRQLKERDLWGYCLM